MAPKKGDAKAAKDAKKAQAEKKQKNAEDKTFGLKNKNRSKVVQQYVKTVKSGVDAKSQKEKRLEAETDPTIARKLRKEAEERKKAELNMLFQEAIKQPPVPPGVDPKSIMCEFHKKGKCTKGFKCKFSHNSAVERKGAKAAIYSAEEEKDDGMEDWDQEQLERAVAQKHAGEKSNATKIVCKFFIEAIEKKQYGWFWVCPNGGKNCQYKHALPPGYVLKSQMKQLMEEELANKKSIEEEIEEERQKVDAATPLTEEVFRQWREKKMEERREREEKAKAERIKGGRYTGREIFAMEGFEAVDDNSASATFEREDRREEDESIREMDRKAKEAQEKARAAEGVPEGGVAAEGPTIRQPKAPSAAAPDAAAGNSAEAGPSAPIKLTKEEEELFLDDDDDDLDEDELAAIEDGIKATTVKD
mmetsp:Transcript_34321/g.87766  ORF Transcript_34321/g.87766 Transcript_34321/m.87766 type:complete len:418 (+) Transcript_34321:140-1393(+)|eukprot:jgi/Tetstr1/449873/TSEL_036932.t1